jgi:galactan 5-O-arabinofuranosyltransferase
MSERVGAGPWAFAGAILVMAVAAAASAPAVTGDPTTDVAVRLCLVAGVAAGGVLLLAPRRALSAAAVAWMVAVLVGAFLATGAVLVLSGSGFPPLGVALDQGFRAASVVKFSHTTALVDFAYKDLPAYYPPLFFWVLGRGAAWSGAEPYEVLKFGLIATALVVPLCSLALWARVTRDWMVAVAIAVTALAFQDWYEPYAWIAAVVFVPWWLRFVVQVGDDHRVPTRFPTVLAGAAIGAAIFCTYYYCFFIGAVHLVVLLALRRAAPHRSMPAFPRDVRRAAIVLGGAAVLSAIYWLPLFVSIATTPGARAMQNRYLDASTLGLPMPFFSFDLVGWCTLFGLAYLAVASWRSEVALALSTLLGAAYLWFVLGYVGILVDVPLLTVKTTALIDVILLTGAAIGAVHVGRVVAGSPVVRSRVGVAGASCALAVGAVMLTLALGSDAIASIPFVEEQRAAAVPTALLDTFTRATRDTDDTVVLTDREVLPEYLPVFVFNVWNAHYSNPAAQFDRRTRFLERLAGVDDPAVFAAALAHNRYDHVDSVALRREGDRLPYTFFDDAFPRGVSQRTITFRVEQFDSAHFASRGSSTLTVYVPRAGDPLRTLDAGQRRALHRTFADDLDDVATG